MLLAQKSITGVIIGVHGKRRKARLEVFRKKWVFHHKLEDEQLKYAGKTGEIVKRSTFRNGDILVQRRLIKA